jgi:hypothetical protein|tara:strand:- start:207 stop:482 length:276 start_codon:yes stop_codon:yes gene_type:complete
MFTFNSYLTAFNAGLIPPANPVFEELSEIVYLIGDTKGLREFESTLREERRDDGFYVENSQQIETLRESIQRNQSRLEKLERTFVFKHILS